MSTKLGTCSTQNTPDLPYVQTVQPGTNVTVDSTDPRNPIVSSTGGGGGGGTVTDVSVTEGTGITASVANPTTTPDITIALSDTAVTPGTYGDGTDAVVVTVNQQGQITAISTDPISGGFTNPMTTEGDMIYENATPAPARLPAGTNGYVLTMVAGVPAWAAASGGGGGDLTLDWLAQ